MAQRIRQETSAHGTDLNRILRVLQRLGDPTAVAGMARYGITARRVFGVSVPKLRALAREIGTDHDLAARLWDEAILETRALASLVDDPALVNSEPHASGWFYKIKLSNPAELNALLSPEDYKKQIGG